MEIGTILNTRALALWMLRSLTTHTQKIEMEFRDANFFVYDFVPISSQNPSLICIFLKFKMKI